MQTLVEQLVGALPEAHKLDTLADWLDLDDVSQRRAGRDEVQQDLRRWASLTHAALDRYRNDPETLLREAGQARREEGERVRDGR